MGVDVASALAATDREGGHLVAVTRIVGELTLTNRGLGRVGQVQIERPDVPAV